jgi:hypothetical protein
MILECLFKDHPRSMGETYLEHQRCAFAFGGTMVLAGIACILHGLLPAVCTTTGSRAVTRLYERMVLNRSRRSTEARGVRVREGAAALPPADHGRVTHSFSEFTFKVDP